MKIAILTNECPPNIYGGAGVHVGHLMGELRMAEDGAHEVQVLCFGSQNEQLPGLKIQGIEPGRLFRLKDPGFDKVADALARDILMAGTLDRADVIHCHTWYTHFAGCLLKQLLRAPLVLTTHSLEPHRPWKEEQLGPAYKVSGWLEETAYRNADGVIAVSGAMKKDVQELYGVPPEKIRVIYNGIDTSVYTPRGDRTVLHKYGIDPEKPFLLFVGRITRQKGIIHLVRAIRHLIPGAQAVLCAGAPDTPEIGWEMETEVEKARRETANPIIWIPGFLPKEEITSLYALASMLVCPSIYEPFGLINVEAMACETPVVGSAVGGIPEIIVEGETGFLVPFEPLGENNPEPRDPEKFSKDLADAINRLLSEPALVREMGAKGRTRAEEVFSWKSIAQQTLEFYKELAER